MAGVFRWYKMGTLARYGLNKFTRMVDFEINNWTILDSLRNIYEIHANLTVMTTLLNF